MPELLEQVKSQREHAVEMRKHLGAATEDERRENLVRSVYASLAIEYSDVTLEEVREALSRESA